MSDNLQGATVASKMRKGPIIAFVLIFVVAAGFGGYQYLNSDKYKNGKIFAAAEISASQGEIANAMELYGQVYRDSEHYKYKAVSGIRKLIQVKILQDVTTSDFANILDTLNSFSSSPLRNMPEDVYQLALTRIKENDSGNSVSMHKLLHGASTLNPDGEDLSDLDLQFIQKINTSNPTNSEIAIELADHYFAKEQMAEVKRVLIPVKDQLGDSEAARMLGQIYLSEGNNSEAYPLLSSYLSSRLEILQASEKEFADLQTYLWDVEFNALNNGEGPQLFYDTYDLKPEEEQQLYVDEFIADKVQKNKDYQLALDGYIEASAIVPVVMDFGILQLRTAEGMSTEEARDKELKAAEETFLAIKNIAGDSDDYKTYLGQVYFWLGKQSEGQALFDEVLASNKRSANSLLSIAGTLRSLGKVGMAAELAKEAYDTSKDDQTRYYAASLMELLSNTIEEKITWLKRSDTNSPAIQASLKDNQGHLASQKGDAKKAAQFYREAIRNSESIAVNASSYNNTALMYFSLHRVSGDKTAYTKGVELMSKAVELRPDDGILLSNAATTLLTNSLYDTVGNSIDYQYLQSPPSLTSIDYYFSNLTEKKALIEKLKSHKDLQKAVDYLQRSILVSPNNVRNYNDLFDIYYFLNDETSISNLVDKMAKNQIDVTSTNKTYIDFVTGVDSDKTVSKLIDAEKFYTSLLTKQKINSETRGAIHLSLSEISQTKVTMDDFSAASRAVVQAEKAVKYMPSAASQSSLSNALMILASVEASEKFPRYKSLRAKSAKSMSDGILVILSTNRDDEVANWLKSNANLKRAVDIELSEYKKFPDYTSPRLWALFKASGSEQADKIGEVIKQSNLRASMQEIQEYTRPLSAATLAYRYWLNQISNKPAIEKSKFDELAEQGVMVPIELFQ